MSQTDYSETDSSSIYQRRFAMMQEPPPSTFDINILRSLTGGDRIDVSTIYQSDPIFFENIRELTRGDRIIARSITGIIARTNRTPVNFIINEFELSEEDKNCCICMSDKNNEQMSRLNCGHSFCVECMDIHLNTKHNCPLCRTDITQIQTNTMESRQKFHH
jgi:hypothetical protein